MRSKTGATLGWTLEGIFVRLGGGDKVGQKLLRQKEESSEEAGRMRDEQTDEGGDNEEEARK